MIAVGAGVAAGSLGLVAGSALADHGSSRSPLSPVASQIDTPVGSGTSGAPGGAACAGRMRHGMAAGTVSSFDGHRLTITGSRGGSVTANVSDSTKVRRMATGSASDVAVGKEIAAGGPVNADGTIAARRVIVGPQDTLPGGGATPQQPPSVPGGALPPKPGGLHMGRMVVGSVTAVDASNITVAGKDGNTYHVLTSATTRYVKVSDASTSDIATGQRVAVKGEPGSDGTIQAQRVTIFESGPNDGDTGPDGFGPPGGPGQLRDGVGPAGSGGSGGSAGGLDLPGPGQGQVEAPAAPVAPGSAA